NFIGVDVKGARIWKGASIALEENLQNAAFLRTRIEQLPLFFEEGEVSEIWITFPDPFLKKGKSNRRLTAMPFLDRYRKVLKTEGLIHLKTDEPVMSEFTLETVVNDEGSTLLYFDDDIYARPLPMPELDFKTYYERIHLAKAKTIKYLRFRIF
ncbi:MAG: tRNA (guanosine(46)-N7)-methyltransferase TrmB, partial [Bacteroidota bacterium]